MTHSILDSINSNGIVSIRDKILNMEAEGLEVLRLESGTPNFNVHHYVASGITKALADNQTFYTAGAGIKELRKAAFHKLRAENKLAIDSFEDVFVTNGAMNALYVTFRALIDPSQNDEVIVSDPTWTETVDNVVMAGGVPVRWPINFQALDGDIHAPAQFDIQSLLRLIGPKTRAIVLNSPHNPTGAVIKYSQLDQLEQIVNQVNVGRAAAAERKLFIVSDEAYEHVNFTEYGHFSPGTEPHKMANCVNIYSMSKSYAMSGLRIGYLAATDKEFKTNVMKLLRCTINGTSSLSQWAGVAALNDQPTNYQDHMLNQYSKRRKILFDALKASNTFVPIAPDGAFFLWCFIREDNSRGIHDSWGATKQLLDDRIGSAPGSVFGSSGQVCVRFSFSCAEAHVQKAADIIRERW